MRSSDTSAAPGGEAGSDHIAAADASQSKGPKAAFRALSSSRVRWVTLAAVVGLILLRYSALGRFTDWDEAVFFSQSGDYEDTGGPSLALAASREGGTPLLVAFFRFFGLELPGVRFMLLVVVLVLGVVAFMWFGRFFGEGAGEIGFVIFGVFWTTIIFSTGIYGSLIWGVLAVLFIAVYLALITGGQSWGLRDALLLGAVIAAMFWMRSLESIFVVGLVGLHSLFWRRAVVWRRTLPMMLLSIATFTILYAVPWAVWSTAEWGSVAARIEAVRGQISRAAGTQLNGLQVYWDSLIGGIPESGLFSIKPTWVWPVIAAFLVLAAIAIVAALIMSSGQSRANLVVVVLPLTVLIVYFVVIYTDAFRDRYLSGMVPLLAAAIGASIAIIRTRVSFHGWGRALGVVGAVFFALWAVAQLAIAEDYRFAQVQNSYITERTVGTVRALAGGQECVGVSRYGRTQVQLGTGCRTYTATNIEDALDRLANFEDSDYFRFIIWPNRDLEDYVAPSDPGWMAISFSTDYRASILFVLEQRCPDDESPLAYWGTGSDATCSP